ncbi:MAG: ParB/RepB/Spo0J family partition protein [Bacilli bacterium]|nr:ParB/RepB/Spo0J family partition protein [Bacilli bacterium]
MKMNKEVVMVRVSDIIPNRFQPRLTFDEEALNELANSIKEHGIIQPLILRDLGSKYEIIAGERRYKASQIAGLAQVPAIIGAMDDQTSAELALIENIQRKDLSAIEEAKSYKKILDMGNFTQDELAKRMGKSQSTVANKMRLLALTNEVQVALMNNLISERHARCLLQVKDEDKQKETLNKIITERMNVRDTDEYIKNMLGIPRVESPAPSIELSASSMPSLENQNITSVEVSNNTTETEKIANEPQIELPNNLTQKIELPTPTETKKSDENPNVYTQTNNIDFIDISSLNGEELQVNNSVKSALSDLNVVDTGSNIFNDNTISVEDKDVQSMITNQNNIITEEKFTVSSEENNMSKVKLATAIRLAKDTVEDIKTAGYTVTMEEIDSGSDYQIIIKVKK